MKNRTEKLLESNLFADFSPVFRVYKDGRVDRMNAVPPMKASLDRETGVESKDVVICPETGVSVRIFNPTNRSKMPLLMYCHGSGFCSGSTFSPMYHRYLNRLAYEGEIVVVSVEYRKATEHPLPAAYDDCWDALMWIFCHNPNTRTMNQLRSNREMATVDAWLGSGCVDFSRVFVAGDSSGANVAHQVTLRAGTEGLGKLIKGLILLQAFFWGKERIGDEIVKCKSRGHGAVVADEIWAAARWGSPFSIDDPWLNPTKDPNLCHLGCERVLINVAEMDSLRDRGFLYKEALKKSGWLGDVQVVDTHGEDHLFQLIKPYSHSSAHLMRHIVAFVNNVQSRL